MSPTTRPARPDDTPLILEFVRELAAYERLASEVEAGVDDIARDLFGRAPRVFCDIAEVDGAPAGFSVWFYSYSTFRGRHGIYLEDLYIRPKARRRGAARALLSRLARRCVDERLGRLEWSVLDWNGPAIGFYDRLGAESMDGWTVRRLSGAAIAALAGPCR